MPASLLLYHFILLHSETSTQLKHQCQHHFYYITSFYCFVSHYSFCINTSLPAMTVSLAYARNVCLWIASSSSSIQLETRSNEMDFHQLFGCSTSIWIENSFCFCFHSISWYVPYLLYLIIVLCACLLLCTSQLFLFSWPTLSDHCIMCMPVIMHITIVFVFMAYSI
jgi:hypothetical protein